MKKECTQAAIKREKKTKSVAAINFFATNHANNQKLDSTW